MIPGDPLIEAQALCKRFGVTRAVDAVSLSVACGEVVGFLGRNGAGKSTTMRLLAGTLRPDSGRVAICGHDMATDRRAGQAQLGYLPEAAAGFGHLTVLEFLTYCGESRGLWRAALEGRIAEACKATDLGPALATRMSALSKGWRQRAWLAQALLADPPVLLLDEPTDGLDPQQKDQVRALVRSLAADKAILLSTHILEEAEEVCDRVVVIAEGRIVADRPCDELLDETGRLAASFRRLTQSPAA